jgi:hypothetical protein
MTELDDSALAAVSGAWGDDDSVSGSCLEDAAALAAVGAVAGTFVEPGLGTAWGGLGMGAMAYLGCERRGSNRSWW